MVRLSFPDDLARAVRERTSLPPPAGSVPFFVNSVRCGVLTPGNVEALNALPRELRALFSPSPEGVALSAPEHALQDSLEAVGRELHARGRLPEWRNEALDVLPWEGTGAPLARAERGIFRFFGLVTQCVHAAGMSADGRFWAGLRAPTKSVDPDLWDTLAGGLVQAGESPETALVRETAEEAGLEPGDYEMLPGTRALFSLRPVETGYLRERTVTRVLRLRDGVPPSCRDGEVARFALFDAPGLLEEMRAGRVTLEAQLALLCLSCEETTE